MNIVWEIYAVLSQSLQNSYTSFAIGLNTIDFPNHVFHTFFFDRYRISSVVLAEYHPTHKKQTPLNFKPENFRKKLEELLQFCNYYSDINEIS